MPRERGVEGGREGSRSRRRSAAERFQAAKLLFDAGAGYGPASYVAGAHDTDAIPNVEHAPPVAECSVPLGRGRRAHPKSVCLGGLREPKLINERSERVHRDRLLRATRLIQALGEAPSANGQGGLQLRAAVVPPGGGARGMHSGAARAGASLK